MFSFLEKRIWQWAALIFLGFMWGGVFLLMKKGLVAFTFMQAGSFRIFFAFIFLIPLIIIKLKGVKKDQIRFLILSGVVGNLIPVYLFAKGQSGLPSSTAGIINSLMPIFALCWGTLLFNEKFKAINLVGMLLGGIGLYGLLSGNSSELVKISYSSVAYLLCANICYGINLNIVKHKLQDTDGITIVAMIFLFIGPIAGIYLSTQDFSAMNNHPQFYESLLYLATMSFVGTVIALIGFNILIKYTSTLFAASVTYISPIFAIMWGKIDGEPFLLIHLLWVSIILLGVKLVNR